MSMSDESIDSLAVITSRATLSDNLPSELCDRVIDFLHEDKETLRACSLVSRQWLSASSFHLFFRLSWPPCKLHWCLSAEQPRYRCRCDDIMDGSRTLAGLIALIAGTQRISSNVRALRVSMAWYGNRDMPTDFAGKPFNREASIEELVEILDLLPRLESLVLRNLKLRPCSAPFRNATRAAQTLQNLQITSSNPNIALQHFYDLLSFFRHVSSLSLRVTGVGGISSAPLLPPTHPLAVNSVEVVINESDFGLVWLERLLRHIDASSVASLAVDDEARASFGGTDDEDADWGYGWETLPLARIALHEFLERCTALRSLTCTPHMYLGLRTYPGSCPTLCELRFVNRYTYTPRSVGLMQLPWRHLRTDLGCNLASAVTDLTLDCTIVHLIPAHERDVGSAVLEQRFRAMATELNWVTLDAVLHRLRSLKMSFAMELQKEASEDEYTVIRSRVLEVSYRIPSDPRRIAWNGDGERYRSILESVARDRLRTLAAQPDFCLAIQVSFKPPL